MWFPSDTQALDEPYKKGTSLCFLELFPLSDLPPWT